MSKKCRIETCDKPSRCLEMCDMHYRRHRRRIKPNENKRARDKWRAKHPGYKSPSNRDAVLVAEKNRAYRAQHKERLDEYARAWRKQNGDKTAIYAQRKRARKGQNGVFAILPKEARRLKKGPCFYCQQSGEMTLDHLIPLVRGGRTSIGNLVSACRSCNSSKRTKLKVEWEQWKKVVSK